MISCFVRRLTVCLAVVAVIGLAPARSKADIQVLVEEYDASGTKVGSSTTHGAPTGGVSFNQAFSYSSAYFTINGFAVTNSNLGTLNSTLTTSFSGGFNSGFDASQGHTLKITVTDDKFTSNGAGVKLSNGASVPLELMGGNLQIDAFSRIYDPASPGAVPASSTSLANGTTVAGPTPIATDSLPSGSSDPRTTSITTSGLPTTYAIQQEILVKITETGTISSDDLFSGSGQARVTTADAVPAPGGLMLALIGLPLVGLRRVFRKRAETATA